MTKRMLRILAAKKAKAATNEVGLKGKAWYDDHMENFVKPQLGHIPTKAEIEAESNVNKCNYIFQLTQPDILKSICEMWEEVKKRANGRLILLPGRDVYIFEILARLEGTKTLSRVDLSSHSSHWAAAHDPQKELFKECYCVDSGAAGSVPKRLQVAEWGLVVWGGAPVAGQTKLTHQLWDAKDPLAGPKYNCYGILECTPKYWQRAYTGDATKSATEFTPTSKIVQTINTQGFLGAAVVTMIVAEYWFKLHPEALVEQVKPVIPIRKLRAKTALTRLRSRGFELIARRRKVSF